MVSLNPTLHKTNDKMFDYAKELLQTYDVVITYLIL